MCIRDSAQSSSSTSNRSSRSATGACGVSRHWSGGSTPPVASSPPSISSPSPRRRVSSFPWVGWILLAACEQLAAWTALSNEPLTVAVNLSRRQLASPLLVANIRTALALTGVQPLQLVLEVTESVLMENPEQAASALTELRALGIRIAVDDFGTGFSSLSYLQRFPVDVLKIDKSFVDPLNESEPASSALVTSIIGLAHSLNLEVVAEGIEREDQFERLIELGCDYGQGYLMARPLDREKSEALVESYQGSSAVP